MTSDTLHRIDEHEFEKAAATLIDAFSDDPVVKNLGLSQKMRTRMYSVPVKVGLHYGEVFATSESCEGVMAICPGKKANMSLMDVIRGGMLLSSLGMLTILTDKGMRRMFGAAEKDKKNLDIGPFIYLNVLGVAQRYQGKGYGGRMVNYLCERADREAQSVYLEALTESNVSWYSKFGFQVIKETVFSDWLTLWEMVRKPG